MIAPGAYLVRSSDGVVTSHLLVWACGHALDTGYPTTPEEVARRVAWICERTGGRVAAYQLAKTSVCPEGCRRELDGYTVARMEPEEYRDRQSILCAHSTQIMHLGDRIAWDRYGVTSHARCVPALVDDALISLETT